MIEINFLRQIQKGENKEKGGSKVVFAISFIVILLTITASATLYFSSFYFSSDISTKESELDTMKKQGGETAEIKTLLKDFAKMKSAVSSGAAKLPAWSEVLNEIAKNTPANVSLDKIAPSADTTIASSAGAAKMNLTITGQSKTRRDLALFILKLSKSKFLTDVKLTKSAESTSSQTATNPTFEIKLNLVPSK